MGVRHTRVELLWSLLSGAESASASFSTASPGGGGTVDVEDLALTATTAFEDQFWSVSSIQDSYGSQVTFLGAKVTALAADGSTEASAVSYLSTPDSGANGLSLPPQCAVVVSLVTPLAGPRHRGRLYLPCPAPIALENAGRLTAATRDEFAARMKDFFDAWNTDPGTFPVAVASNVGVEVTTVTKIKIGNIVDTQRRRRDQLPEVYATQVLA